MCVCVCVCVYISKLGYPRHRVNGALLLSLSRLCVLDFSVWVSIIFVFILMKTQHPVYIIVFGVVIGDGDAMPPSIFSHGIRLNLEAQIKR